MKGTVINHQYQILQQLGEGGTSLVYRALDLDCNQTVVVKMMKSNLTSTYMDDLIRFKREVEIASGFHHPNIVKIFGAGEYQTIPYIVMELLAGKSLADWLREGSQFTLQSAMQLIYQLAETLGYIHHHGIIHRDVKPGNIQVIGVGGARERAKLNIKLLDFGISHLLELSAIKDKELIAGTFGYMSPEATGILNRKTDERSDLYSLGVVFYQLVTGEMPFQGTEAQQILHQQAALIPARPVTLNPKIPRILDEVIMKLLMKDPDQRYQSAAGLLSDLDQYLRGETGFTVGANDLPQKLTYQTSELIGRSGEMARLKELLDQAGKGRGSICFITGEAGIGKSRLAVEMQSEVYRQNGLFLKGRCLNHRNKSPYQPLRDALDEYINWFEKSAPGIQGQETARLRECLGDLGRIALQLNPRLEKVIGPVKQLVPIEPERENKRFLMVLAAFLCWLTDNGKPNLLFLDDFQWADEGTLELLEAVMWNIQESNLMILATCRDGEPGVLHNLEGLETRAGELAFRLEKIPLNAFDNEHTADLIANLLHTQTPIPSDLNRYVLENSNGNPFFTIHIIRELVENQALIRQEKGLETDWSAIRQIPVSGTIVDVILRRMKNLPPEPTDILCKASVIGREFDILLLLKLSGLPETAVVNMVDDFIALQLLEKSVERGRLLFAHDRIRDAFYHQLSDLRKQEIHLKIAAAIEESKDHLPPDRTIFELAHHYLEGGDHHKALQYVWPAARAAKSSYANEQAIKYYQKAIELLEGQGNKGNCQWIEARQDLMEILVMVGRNEEAITLSRDLLLFVTEPLARARLYKKIGTAYFFNQGDWSKSETYIRQGLKLLHHTIPTRPLGVYLSIGKELLIHFVNQLFPATLRHPAEKPIREKDREIVASCISLTWLYGLSEVIKYVNITLQILNLAETRIGKSRELGVYLSSYGLILASLPLFKHSLRIHIKAGKMLQELGDEWAIAMNFQLLGYTLCWQGNHGEGIHYLESARDKFQRIGDLWEEGACWIHLGINYRRVGNFPKSFASMDADAKTCLQLNDTFGNGFNITYYAILLIESGDLAAAEAKLRKGLVFSGDSNNLFLRCLVIHVYGLLELERANYDEAIRYLEEAHQIYRDKMLHKDYVLGLFPWLVESYLKKAEVQAGPGKRSALGKPPASRKQLASELKKIRKLCREALKETKAWPNYYGAALRVTAGYFALAGNSRRAEQYYLKGIEHLQQFHLQYEAAKCYFDYCRFLQAAGRTSDAIQRRDQAYLIFKEIGAMVYIRRCEEWYEMGRARGKENQFTNAPAPGNRLASERRKNAIIATSQDISSILDINILLEKVMDNAIELVGAERGILLLYSGKDPNRLEPKVIRKITPSEISPPSTHMSWNIISQVEREQRPLIIADALADDTLKNQASVMLSGIRSVIGAPILLKGKMIGVIYLDNRLISGLFTEEDLEVINLFANQAGVSIENARLCQSLEQRVQERTEQLEAANRELNQKNAELSAANEQLKEHAAMAAELAVTKERNRAAMDFHDTIGHTMTLLIKLLEICKVFCRKDPLKAEQELVNAINITREGLQDVRRSITGLMPERIGAVDLPSALEKLISGFSSSGVNIDFVVEGAPVLPDVKYSDAIYKTCQEALTNALRHGKAKTVAILLKFSRDKVKLYIVDDGCGCKEVKKGNGLRGMEKRIQGLNGNFRFSSDGATGFHIQVEIPLTEERTFK